MNGYSNPTVFGVQMVQDGSDGNQAYKTNAIRAAEACGYKFASDTAISVMGVRDGRPCSRYDIGTGLFNSAMCVEWYARGLNPSRPPSVLKITPSLLSAFTCFYGARTTAEAKDSSRIDHEFLRGVFSAPLGAEIWIEWDDERM